MKKAFCLTAFIAFTIIGFAESQSPEKETRDLKGFTKVSFGVSGYLYIDFGSEFKVILEGDKAILDNIITEVSQSKLLISKENRRFNNNEKITIYITMPEITGLSVSGSGTAEIKGDLETQVMALSVSGSGKLNTADIMVSDLKSSISGSGSIIIGGGIATTVDLSISGSGNYSVDSTIIKKAVISISGSGNCTCHVTESLKASISGSGNVTYLGNPEIDARVSGSGKVRSK